eukprot:jgi/Chrzof1/14219/Cz08g30010.t1
MAPAHEMAEHLLYSGFTRVQPNILRTQSSTLQHCYHSAAVLLLLTADNVKFARPPSGTQVKGLEARSELLPRHSTTCTTSYTAYFN